MSHLIAVIAKWIEVYRQYQLDRKLYGRNRIVKRVLSHTQQPLDPTPNAIGRAIGRRNSLRNS